MTRYGLYECPLGTLVIGYADDRIVSVKLVSDTLIPHSPSPLSDLAAMQLRQYFDGSRRSFDLPVSASGTTFQLAVLQAIGQIPYGETRTYGQIAAMLGKPKAARAVGQAANRNPLWIVTPCHRVVGKGETLTGYAGGMDIKQALLDLERNNR